jgi:sporulation protein YlmC with PRC-barrel domain
VEATLGDEEGRATMDGEQLAIGETVRCRDGECGRLIKVVIDPVARVATHVIVEPAHREGLGRLVSLDLVTSKGGSLELACTLSEFEGFEIAEETHFLPGTPEYLEYESGQLLAQPYYVFGAGNSSLPVTTDTLPKGEVAVRRDEVVHASDGEIGRVEGLVIDPGDQHVTHLLLQEGHLFGHKDVAIPIGAITRIDDGVWLTLTKHEIEQLPPTEVERTGT